MKEPHIVFFVGKPGCGKGTQSKALAAHTGWHVFAAGALFREIAAQDSPVGRKIKEETESGLLAPSWFAMHLYLRALLSVHQNESVIFDGFNRTVHEASLVIDSLRWLGRSFSVVNLVITDDEVRRRLQNRKETSGRADDHAVAERLKEYYTHTEPAIELFRKAGVLFEVDGDGKHGIEPVAKHIRELLHIA